MALNTNAFFEQYAQVAIDQQIKYGIPASITLAQMALESGYGTSDAATKSNNFFGVKVGSSWNGAYDLYNDDKANEKFRRYDSVMQSVEDHSAVLMNGRYRQCQAFASTDYTNWAIGIKAGGYASDKDYANKLIGVIEKQGLAKYDQMAVSQAQQQGLQIGYMRGRQQPAPQEQTTLAQLPGHWSLPMQLDGLPMTGEYGEQRSGHRHGGIDISTNRQSLPVFATEDNGKVVAAKANNGAAGNTITVEYNRADGTKFQTTYMHLSQIGVKEGDTVNAGQQIGVSGNTGRSTGPHLHFETKFMDAAGNWTRFNPEKYLAEIEVRSGTATALNRNGEDTLAQYRSQMHILPNQQPGIAADSNQALLANITNSNDPSKWLAYLMNNNNDMSSGRDMISELISTMFSAAITVAMSLRTSEEVKAEDAAESQMKASAQAADNTVKMQRTALDAQKVQQMASATFEAESSDNVQQQGLRQA